MNKIKKLKMEVLVYRILALGMGLLAVGICLMSIKYRVDYPTIEWVKYSYKDDSVGQYFKFLNHITIDTDSPNQFETICHEYSHWIYQKRMTKEDKEYFIKDICEIENSTNISKMYKQKEVCEEVFVRGLAKMMIHKSVWIEPEYDNIIFKGYMEQMYYKYVY